MKMTDTVFSNGCIELDVPECWKVFSSLDSDGKITPKKVHVYKDASVDVDIFTHAGITVCMYGKSEYYLSPKFFYDDVCDIEPFTVGKNTWNGFSCTSLGYPYIILDTKQDGCTIQVMILLQNGDRKISLDDEDVKKIIGNISVTEIE